MAIVATAIILFVVFLVFLHLIERRTKKFQTAQKLPGPGLLFPLIGNGLSVAPLTPMTAFTECRKNAAKYRNGYRYYFFGKLYIFTHSLDAFEAIVNLNNTSKGDVYSFFHELVGLGLLTSNGQKWTERRKMITPAFHFNILKQFLVVFSKHADHFVRMVGNDTSGTVLTERIPSYSLDVICETSMGADSLNLDTSDYLKNFHTIDRKIAERISNPFIHHDISYRLFGYKKEVVQIATKTQNFAKELIAKRRVVFQNSPSRQNANARTKIMSYNEQFEEEDNAYFQKNRFALLDSLLAAELQGVISDEGIEEEVNTFVFTGHDTVSNGIIYTLMCIAEYPDVQAKLYDELHSAFSKTTTLENFERTKRLLPYLNFVIIENTDQPLTVTQIASLPYLDLVVKESLRMFPPVPVISRVLLEEMELNGVVLPVGTEMNMFIYDLHYNPENFPDPTKFIPERFLPENVEKRHHYAYLPFSGGMRNCVGQKFAMLELKTLVIKLVLAYRLESVTKIKDLIFLMEMILHTNHPIKLSFVPRK